MFATITAHRINALKTLRSLDSETASTLRAAMFSSIKSGFGIPSDHKIKVEIDDTTSPRYATLVRKSTDTAYTLLDNGQVDLTTPAAPVPPPVQYRWFVVDASDIKAFIVDSREFDEGVIDLPGVGEDHGGYVFNAMTGEMAVHMPETDF